MEGTVVLKTDPDSELPLARNEKPHAAKYFAHVGKALDQAHFVYLTLVASVPIKVVPDPDNVQGHIMEGDMTGLMYSIEDGTNGDSVFVFKQPACTLVLRPEWQRSTLEENKPEAALVNWRRAMTGVENNLAQHQYKADDPIYFVSHFTLPFKCVKKIEENYVNAMFDDADGAFIISFLLWELDQSGRNSVTVKKASKTIKTKK